MYVARSGSSVLPYGSTRKVDYLQGPSSPVQAGWPGLLARVGTTGATIGAYARSPGPGADGFGGFSAFPVNYQPQTTWLEGGGHKGYGINIPLRLRSADVSERCPPDQEIFICGGVLKFETLNIPITAPSGSFVSAWDGTTGSLVLNPLGGTAAAARVFGVGPRPGDGALSFIAVNGLTVTSTPIVHPGGDRRLPLWVEYRIRNAQQGRTARLELWLNNTFALAGAFVVGDALGLFSTYNSAAESGLIHTTFADAAVRVWHGQIYWACGPDASTTL